MKLFELAMSRQPRVEIVYCAECGWLLRSAWMAQELLSTFSRDLGEVALVPASDATFEIRIDEQLIWSRTANGGFPEIKQLKRLVRDRIAPQRDLGHLDRES